MATQRYALGQGQKPHRLLGGVETQEKMSWGVWVKGEGQACGYLVGGALFDGIAEFFGRSDLVLSCVKGAGEDVAVVCERDVG